MKDSIGKDNGGRGGGSSKKNAARPAPGGTSSVPPPAAPPREDPVCDDDDDDEDDTGRLVMDLDRMDGAAPVASPPPLSNESVRTSVQASSEAPAVQQKTAVEQKTAVAEKTVVAQKTAVQQKMDCSDGGDTKSSFTAIQGKSGVGEMSAKGKSPVKPLPKAKQVGKSPPESGFSERGEEGDSSGCGNLNTVGPTNGANNSGSSDRSGNATAAGGAAAKPVTESAASKRKSGKPVKGGRLIGAKAVSAAKANTVSTTRQLQPLPSPVQLSLPLQEKLPRGRGAGRKKEKLTKPGPGTPVKTSSLLVGGQSSVAMDTVDDPYDFGGSEQKREEAVGGRGPGRPTAGQRKKKQQPMNSSISIKSETSAAMTESETTNHGTGLKSDRRAYSGTEAVRSGNTQRRVYSGAKRGRYTTNTEPATSTSGCTVASTAHGTTVGSGSASNGDSLASFDSPPSGGRTAAPGVKTSVPDGRTPALAAQKSATGSPTDCPSQGRPVGVSAVGGVQLDASTDTGMDSVGTMTEPDTMGLCDSGTSINLEGIVWEETDNGVLVVNVTWRGKSYVGMLMDQTQHNWAPQRLSCDSPLSDQDAANCRSGGGPKSRGTTGRRRRGSLKSAFPEINERQLRRLGRSAAARSTGTASPTRSVTPGNGTTGSKRRAATTRGNAAVDDHEGEGPDWEETPPVAKRGRREVANYMISKGGVGSDGGLIPCPEANCHKKYKHINGLRYHQSHAHKNSSGGDEGIDEEPVSRTTSTPSCPSEVPPGEEGDESAAAPPVVAMEDDTAACDEEVASATASRFQKTDGWQKASGGLETAHDLGIGTASTEAGKELKPTVARKGRGRKRADVCVKEEDDSPVKIKQEKTDECAVSTVAKGQRSQSQVQSMEGHDNKKLDGMATNRYYSAQSQSVNETAAEQSSTTHTNPLTSATFQSSTTHTNPLTSATFQSESSLRTQSSAAAQSASHGMQPALPSVKLEYQGVTSVPQSVGVGQTTTASPFNGAGPTLVASSTSIIPSTVSEAARSTPSDMPLIPSSVIRVNPPTTTEFPGAVTLAPPGVFYAAPTMIATSMPPSGVAIAQLPTYQLSPPSGNAGLLKPVIPFLHPSPPRQKVGQPIIQQLISKASSGIGAASGGRLIAPAPSKSSVTGATPGVVISSPAGYATASYGMMGTGSSAHVSTASSSTLTPISTLPLCLPSSIHTTLKPIQPKPTRLGETQTNHPAISALKEQKKKKKASREMPSREIPKDSVQHGTGSNEYSVGGHNITVSETGTSKESGTEPAADTPSFAMTGDSGNVTSVVQSIKHTGRTPPIGTRLDASPATDSPLPTLPAKHPIPSPQRKEVKVQPSVPATVITATCGDMSSPYSDISDEGSDCNSDGAKVLRDLHASNTMPAGPKRSLTSDPRSQQTSVLRGPPPKQAISTTSAQPSSERSSVVQSFSSSNSSSRVPQISGSVPQVPSYVPQISGSVPQIPGVSQISGHVPPVSSHSHVPPLSGLPLSDPEKMHTNSSLPALPQLSTNVRVATVLPQKMSSRTPGDLDIQVGSSAPMNQMDREALGSANNLSLHQPSHLRNGNNVSMFGKSSSTPSLTIAAGASQSMTDKRVLHDDSKYLGTNKETIGHDSQHRSENEARKRSLDDHNDLAGWRPGGSVIAGGITAGVPVRPMGTPHSGAGVPVRPIGTPHSGIITAAQPHAQEIAAHFHNSLLKARGDSALPHTGFPNPSSLRDETASKLRDFPASYRGSPGAGQGSNNRKHRMVADHMSPRASPASIALPVSMGGALLANSFSNHLLAAGIHPQLASSQLGQPVGNPFGVMGMGPGPGGIHGFAGSIAAQAAAARMASINGEAFGLSSAGFPHTTGAATLPLGSGTHPLLQVGKHERHESRDLEDGGRNEQRSRIAAASSLHLGGAGGHPGLLGFASLPFGMAPPGLPLSGIGSFGSLSAAGGVPPQPMNSSGAGRNSVKSADSRGRTPGSMGHSSSPPPAHSQAAAAAVFGGLTGAGSNPHLMLPPPGMPYLPKH